MAGGTFFATFLADGVAGTSVATVLAAAPGRRGSAAVGRGRGARLHQAFTIATASRIDFSPFELQVLE